MALDARHPNDRRAACIGSLPLRAYFLWIDMPVDLAVDIHAIKPAPLNPSNFPTIRMRRRKARGSGLRAEGFSDGRLFRDFDVTKSPPIKAINSFFQ